MRPVRQLLCEFHKKKSFLLRHDKNICTYIKREVQEMGGECGLRGNLRINERNSRFFFSDAAAAASSL